MSELDKLVARFEAKALRDDPEDAPAFLGKAREAYDRNTDPETYIPALLGLLTGYDKEDAKNLYDQTIVPPVQQVYDQYLRPHVPEGIGFSGSPFSPEIFYESPTGGHRFDLDTNRMSYTNNTTLPFEGELTASVGNRLDNIGFTATFPTSGESASAYQRTLANAARRGG